MKKIVMAIALMGVMGGAFAAQPSATPQQQKMTACNYQASQSSLKGNERKAYMSSCLKKDAKTTSGKTLTPQQQKMKDCNAQAKTQSLAGADRKTFMSGCLKK